MHTATMCAFETNHATILGSKKKLLSIQELLENRKMDPVFTSFCSHVSLAIQALSSEPADTIAINNSQQVQLFILLMSHFNIHIWLITFRWPSINSSRWNTNWWSTGTSKKTTYAAIQNSSGVHGMISLSWISPGGVYLQNLLLSLYAESMDVTTTLHLSSHWIRIPRPPQEALIRNYQSTGGMSSLRVDARWFQWIVSCVGQCWWQIQSMWGIILSLTRSMRICSHK